MVLIGRSGDGLADPLDAQMRTLFVLAVLQISGCSSLLEEPADGVWIVESKPIQLERDCHGHDEVTGESFWRVTMGIKCRDGDRRIYLLSHDIGSGGNPWNLSVGDRFKFIRQVELDGVRDDREGYFIVPADIKRTDR